MVLVRKLSRDGEPTPERLDRRDAASELLEARLAKVEQERKHFCERSNHTCKRSGEEDKRMQTDEQTHANRSECRPMNKHMRTEACPITHPDF
jgi:hypothetical protein